MEVAATAAVGAVLGLWLVASVVHQVSPGWWSHVNRFDRLRLLPQWHFFAPRPGRTDHHLVIRDVVDGVAGEWREIETGESPPVTRWCVNPPRFRQKALSDLANSLLSARRTFEEHVDIPHAERLSMPYLAVLAWSVAQPAAVLPCQRQFAVVATAGHGAERDLRVIYISGTHTLEGDDGGS